MSAANEAARARTRPRKRAELIAGELRAEIVRRVRAGELAPGDPLPSSKELMARFDVAAPTFREAMRLLEAESLIELRVGLKGGAFVRVPDTTVAAAHVALLLELRNTTFEDVWGMRAVLEPLAARLAAVNPQEDGVARLRAVTAAAAAAADDVGAFVELTARFRDELVAQAGSETLRLLCALLHDILLADSLAATRTIRRPESMTLGDFHRLAVKAESRLIDLIEAGDADEAEAYWRRHILAVNDLIGDQRGRHRLLDAISTPVITSW